MPKVLHILSLKRRAGVEVMFINFLKHMKKTNPELLHKQVIFATHISKQFEKELNNLGITFYINEQSTKHRIKILLQIRRVLKTHNIDVVYGQNFSGNSLSAMASIGLKIRLICHEHGSAWNASGIKAMLTYFWVKRADLIICNSSAAKVLLNQRFHALKEKITVIYNGVPKNNSNTTPLKKDKNRLLFVGRLDPVKSPDTVIRCLPYLIQKFPEIQLDILGDGGLEDELKELAKKLGVMDHVNFRGNVTNVSEFMARSALLVLPSVREALGNVTIEAAHQNTATVGTNIDGISEVIEHKQTGILIDPEIECSGKGIPKFVVHPDKNVLVKPRKIDPKKLADQIYWVLINGNHIKFGENANKHVKVKFSMSEYYDKVLSEIN